jgi:hypothetical protein
MASRAVLISRPTVPNSYFIAWNIVEIGLLTSLSYLASPQHYFRDAIDIIVVYYLSNYNDLCLRNRTVAKYPGDHKGRHYYDMSHRHHIFI